MTIADNSQQQRRLVQVYEIRLYRAEQEVRKQIESVRESEAELAQRQGKVALLQAQLDASFQFLMKCTDIAQIHSAQNYNKWLKDDIERESFYVDMTRDELAEKKELLQEKKKQLAKIEARRDTVLKLAVRQRIKNETLNEVRLDEEGRQQSLQHSALAH